jgi:hypothetical protein
MAATGREGSERVSVPTTDSKMYQTMRRQPADIRRLEKKHSRNRAQHLLRLMRLEDMDWKESW